uniref:uncharacterized protein LOC120338715 n=1 Tax=Styela clava TaxID=7725 RepID=UPI001939D58A|nr:uncharacterized protein LOC120338715 [Styela clava]
MDRKEDTGASGSGSFSQSQDRSSVDLEVSNHDFFVAGSSSTTLLKTDQSTNVEIKDSNIHIIGGKSMLTEGEGATTIIRDSVIKIEWRTHNDSSPSLPALTETPLQALSNAKFDPVYEGNSSSPDAAPPHPSPSFVATGTPVQPLPDTAIAPVYKANSPGFFQQVTKKLFGGVRRFIDYFNWRTWKQTTVNVTESYKDQNLEEPEFEVNPKLNKVTGFYRGQMAPDVTEYRKEQEFAVTEANENIVEVISPNELVQQLCEEGCRCVGLVGQAGGGKTTMMKRTARGVLVANELDNESKAKLGLFARLFRKQKNGFKFVHHLNFRDLLVSFGLTPEEALTPCTLLFGNFAPNLSDQTLKRDINGFSNTNQKQFSSLMAWIRLHGI